MRSSVWGQFVRYTSCVALILDVIAAAGCARVLTLALAHAIALALTLAPALAHARAHACILCPWKTLLRRETAT